MVVRIHLNKILFSKSLRVIKDVCFSDPVLLASYWVLCRETTYCAVIKYVAHVPSLNRGKALKLHSRALTNNQRLIKKIMEGSIVDVPIFSIVCSELGLLCS